jgi:hypothetical protein
MMILVLLAGVGGLCVSSSLAGGLAYSQNWLCDSLGENFGMDCTAAPGAPSPSGDSSSVPPSNSDDDSNDSNKKDHCVYLYEDKDGKKFLVSKCTKSSTTYKDSKLDTMSSLIVGKDIKVTVYDKDGKKKTYQGKKDKVYNLSGTWDNKTKKLVVNHTSSDSGGSSSGGNKTPISVGNDPKNTYWNSANKTYLYTDKDFLGSYLAVEKEDRMSDMSDKNDTISSMRIQQGYKMKAYENPDYKGAEKHFKGNIKWIGNTWNDRISSFKIVKD